MTATVGRIVVDVLTNKSGGSVAYGDVVVLDSTNDDAFTTDSSGAFTGIVGVCIEPGGIANNASGRIQTQGPVAQINCSASVTRGHYLKTHTVVKQAADAGTSRVVGAFAKTKNTSSTPRAILFGFPDAASSSATAGTPAVTLSTTNGAGVAATFVATDATIAIFDATVPVTQAASDAAATGSAGVAARRDHKHGMPAASGLLAVHEYTATADKQTSGTSFAFIDSTNIFVTFTAPASGQVLIRFSATAEIGASAVALFWGLHDGSADVSGSEESVMRTGSGGSADGRPCYEKLITGLTPGNSYTYKMRHRVGSGSSGFVLNNSVCVMTAWAA